MGSGRSGGGWESPSDHVVLLAGRYDTQQHALFDVGAEHFPGQARPARARLRLFRVKAPPPIGCAGLL